MSHGGDGGIVRQIGIRKNSSVIQQMPESTFVFRLEPGQVIVAELVDRDQHHQLGPGREWLGDSRRDYGCQSKPYHGISLQGSHKNAPFEERIVRRTSR